MYHLDRTGGARGRSAALVYKRTGKHQIDYWRAFASPPLKVNIAVLPTFRYKYCFKRTIQGIRCHVSGLMLSIISLRVLRYPLTRFWGWVCNKKLPARSDPRFAFKITCNCVSTLKQGFSNFLFERPSATWVIIVISFPVKPNAAMPCPPVEGTGHLALFHRQIRTVPSAPTSER